jgi:hypothetical protein
MSEAGSTEPDVEQVALAWLEASIGRSGAALRSLLASPRSSATTTPARGAGCSSERLRLSFSNSQNSSSMFR